MMKFEMKGLNALEKNLRDMGRRVQALNGEHDVPFDELFTSAFMQK